jgi:2Fe-2S ferredoxin
MPTLIVLPHPELAPAGATLEATPGTSVCDTLLDNGIEIEHACGKVGACTTCHVIVVEGYQSLNEVGENEEDMLDRAWGLQPNSRLSCQAIVDNDDLTIEIPRYTINLAKENG